MGSVAIENSLSRQRFFCRNKFLIVLCHDRDFSVATENDRPRVAIGFPSRDMAWGFRRPSHATIDLLGRATARMACAQLCMRQTCDSALCRALFGITIHGHCSRTLFMGTVQKIKK